MPAYPDLVAAAVCESVTLVSMIVILSWPRIDRGMRLTAAFAERAMSVLVAAAASNQFLAA
jgi:hypothetical protein